MLEYVYEFEQHMLTNEVSKNTSVSYKRDAQAFVKYIKEHDFVSLTDVLPSDIKQYADFLRASGKSGATVTRNIAAIRAFYKYLMSAGIVLINPAVNIKPEKTDKKIPEILTVCEIKNLLEQPDTNTFKGCRDKAMLELLYATGMRISELLEINLSDVNTEYAFVVIKHSDNERTVPFHNIAVQALNNYIKDARMHLLKNQENSALFLNTSGKRLSRQGFWKILKSYTESAEIKKEITPHTIRHSFAVHMIENGASVKDLQQLMGHADISSTQAYVQLMKKYFYDRYGIYHPRIFSDSEK